MSAHSALGINRVQEQADRCAEPHVEDVGGQCGKKRSDATIEFKRGRRLFNASQERVFRIVQRQKAEHEFREAPPLIGGQHFNDGQKQRTKQCLKIRTACAIYFRKPLLPSLFHRWDAHVVNGLNQAFTRPEMMMNRRSIRLPRRHENLAKRNAVQTMLAKKTFSSDNESTRRSEEHTSELQSLMRHS